MFSLMCSKSILWTRHRSQHNIYKPYLSLESSFAGNMIGPIVIFLCHVMLLHSQGQLQIHSFRAYNESCVIHNQTKKLGKNVCKMRQMHCYFNEQASGSSQAPGIALCNDVVSEWEFFFHCAERVIQQYYSETLCYFLITKVILIC